MCHYETEKGALISAWKCTKSVWWPGSARTRWVSLQRSQDLPTWILGVSVESREGEGKETGRGQRRKGWQGKDRKDERGGMEGRGRAGKEGIRGRQGKISPPRSFVKVGAYVLLHSTDDVLRKTALYKTKYWTSLFRQLHWVSDCSTAVRGSPVP